MKLNVGIPDLKRGTSIKDIKVPRRLRERHKTGLDWFDSALGGDGFVPSSVMMLTGDAGCGKTTLALQLADAIKSQGHECLFNTGEQSLYQVAMTSERLGLESGYTCGQDILCSDVIDHARDLQKSKRQTFLIQDSLPTLDDGKYGDGGTTGRTPMRCVEMLAEWAKSTYGIVIFINHVGKNGDFIGRNTVKHAIDQHAEVWFDREKRSQTYGERLFKLSKNRFGVSGKTYIVGMSEKGLYEKGEVQYV